MSFILDALRKSETERRRTATPMLAGVPVEVTRASVPYWTWGIIAALGVTVVALGGAWWTSTRQPVIGQLLPTNTTQSAGSDTVRAPAEAVSVAEGADGNVALQPPELPPTRREGLSADKPVTPTASPTAIVQTDALAAPEQPASAAPVVAPAAAVARVARPALPTLEEALAGGLRLPELRLELHVYHPESAGRWVYINGTRYTEGRRLADGPLVVEIVPEGVVLAQDGNEFLLLAQ